MAKNILKLTNRWYASFSENVIFVKWHFFFGVRFSSESNAVGQRTFREVESAMAPSEGFFLVASKKAPKIAQRRNKQQHGWLYIKKDTSKDKRLKTRCVCTPMTLSLRSVFAVVGNGKNVLNRPPVTVAITASKEGKTQRYYPIRYWAAKIVTLHGGIIEQTYLLS